MCCLLMASIKERLLNDVDKDSMLPDIKNTHVFNRDGCKLQEHRQERCGISCAPSEGRGDTSSLYMSALLTTPPAKRNIASNSGISNLMEQPRADKQKCDASSSGDSGGSSDSSAITKSWRDICGASILCSVAFPVSSVAFYKACMRLYDGDPDAKWKRNVEECINLFNDAMLEHANAIFDFRGGIYPCESDRQGRERIVGTEHVKTVFMQQKSFYHHLHRVNRNCGNLWGALQLNFCHQNKKGQKRKRDAGFEEEDMDCAEQHAHDRE